MNYAFQLLKITRQNILNVVQDLDETALNHIPPNFNNNLAWNLGHVLVTQELLCYKMAGLPCNIKEEWITKYKKGSKPSATIAMDEIQLIKDLLLTKVDRTQAAYEAEKFTAYNTYTTSYNATLNSIENAINFNNVHEGLHLGYMMALKRLL